MKYRMVKKVPNNGIKFDVVNNMILVDNIKSMKKIDKLLKGFK